MRNNFGWEAPLSSFGQFCFEANQYQCFIQRHMKCWWNKIICIRQYERFPDIVILPIPKYFSRKQWYVYFELEEEQSRHRLQPGEMRCQTIVTSVKRPGSPPPRYSPPEGHNSFAQKTRSESSKICQWLAIGKMAQEGGTLSSLFGYLAHPMCWWWPSISVSLPIFCLFRCLSAS